MNTMYRMAASAAPGVAVELGHDPDRDDYRHDVLRSGAAPTPLYHQYQESFGLTPFTVTIIFAAGVLSLLMAPLTVRLHRPPRGPNCPWYPPLDGVEDVSANARQVAALARGSL